MSHLTLKSKEDGFSMVEIFFGIVIFTIGTFIFYSVLAELSNVNSRTHSFYDFLQMKNKIFNIIKNNDSCTQTFMNQELNKNTAHIDASNNLIPGTLGDIKGPDGQVFFNLYRETDAWRSKDESVRVVKVIPKRMSTVILPVNTSSIELVEVEVHFQKRPSLENAHTHTFMFSKTVAVEIRQTAADQTVISHCFSRTDDMSVFNQTCGANEALVGFTDSGTPECRRTDAVRVPNDQRPPITNRPRNTLFLCPRVPNLQAACIEPRGGGGCNEFCPNTPPLSNCTGQFVLTTARCSVAEEYFRDPTEGGINLSNRRTRCFRGYNVRVYQCVPWVNGLNPNTMARVLLSTFTIGP